MRIRTTAAALLAAAALTACTTASDDDAASPADACLAGLVKAYPSLDPNTPMLDQVDACEGLDNATESSVLETLNAYDDALRQGVEAAE